MKKNIFLSLILLSFFLFSSGQKNTIEFGFQSGLNLNSAYGNAINKDYKGVLTGLSIGGHFKVNMTKHFGLKAILSYDQYGWAYRSLTFEDSWGSGLVKGDVLNKLNYLNLPILAEYSFGEKIKFNINGGVFFGYLLNNKMVIIIKEPTVSNNESTSDNYKSANFGLSVGAGVQIPVTAKIKFDFGIRNSTGLTNIYTSNTNNNSSIIKTNSFLILAGVVFNIKK